jgi:hypothetical protein
MRHAKPYLKRSMIGDRSRNEEARADRRLLYLLLASGLLGLGWFGPGCASSRSTPPAPKPGRGIAEYRDVTREAHDAVAATINALDLLMRPKAKAMLEHPDLPDFDRAFYQLELTSVRARARAEAIIARGQKYFDEWKENLVGIKDPNAAQLEAARYTRLLIHFDRVRLRSSEVRNEFRPFMGKLRQFRARVDQPAKVTGDTSSWPELDALRTGGRRVLESLDSVSLALNDAETELRATRAAQ